MIDLTEFAVAVGPSDPVSVSGLASRGGPVHGVRAVSAPSGIDFIQPDEMIVCCGAGTHVDVLNEALGAHRQTVALPAGGTVGGALAVGRSDVHRLGHGPVRDVLLQARYVSATGEVVKAGGPTVKNVSGFDLCRLLVGSFGTLGFLGEVMLRTRPLPQHSQWFTAATPDPMGVFTALYRPASVLWDGSSVWVLLEGHPKDVHEQAARCRLEPTDGPPPLPSNARRSLPPGALLALRPEDDGPFVAELGVGIVHAEQAPPPVVSDARVKELASAIKRNFDPTGRLNPGVTV